jgi:DNA-binding transcriptional MocR family regulator
VTEPEAPSELHGGWHPSTEEVVSVLGEGWVKGPGPLYEKLASSLQAAVEYGHLPPGTSLPSERALAQALFVSRNTVVAAYGRLRAIGVVDSRRGSGTWVRGRAAGRFGDEETLGMLTRDPYLSTFIDENPVAIDLTIPTPRAAFDELATGVLFAGAGPELLQEATPLGYQPRGLPSFRRAVAAYLESRGLPTSENDVLITTGAQQAISLLLQLFLRRGDEIAVENPTYRGLIDALLFARARVCPLAIDDPELPARLHSLSAERRPRLIYLTATCHNPTGHTVGAATRREIVRVAERHGIPVIEDAVLADLDLGEAPPYLAAFATRASSVIVIGSLSKVVWGGLRVGWIRASSPVISRLARLKALADMGTSTVSQVIALRAMASLDSTISTQRAEVATTLALMEESLRTHVPAWTWRRPSGGRSIWARLPAGTSKDFAQLALLHGVAVSAGSALCFDGAGDHHLRLPFVQSPGVIEEACRRLGDAWSFYTTGLEAG